MNTLNYYKDNYVKMFNSISNPNFRIWKVIDEDGFCRQNKYQITTPERLWRFIKQCKNPQKVYVSISTFLNPNKNHGNFRYQVKVSEDGHYYYPKAGYITADCNLLDSYFFIDLDAEHDLTLAQEDARKIMNYMKKKKDYKLKLLQFSGTKGVHLLYEDKLNKHIPHPTERIKYYHKRKKELIKELLTLNLSTIDKNHINVMNDLFRVYSCPLSIKPNGNVVTQLNPKDFMEQDIYSLIGSGGKAIEAKANESKVATSKSNILQPKNIKGKGRDGLSTYPYYYGFIGNYVSGLKNNYVPFLKFHKEQKIDLTDLSNEIGNLILFYEEGYMWVIGMKIMQKNKLLKLMRRLKAKNYSETSRKYSKFRITNVVNKYGVELKKAPLLTKSIKSDKKYTYSRPHNNFFNKFIADNLAGRDKLSTFRAEVTA